MIKEVIKRLIDGEDLSLQATKYVMNEIMNGKATDSQIASFIVALRMKGETIDEITAGAQIMREYCSPLKYEGDIVDIVGTGGDQAATFNISTISAFVIAAAGIPVAKHGNRGVSSKCGSADLLEALGAKIDISVENSERILKKIGFCFMYAPFYHTSMKNVAIVRKELGVRTIFNILGPLTNPARAKYQLLGVYDEKMLEPMARVLGNLGLKKAMVVHGHDGLDEITLTSPSTICLVANGSVKKYQLDPQQMGFTYCSSEELKGGDPQENADIARKILGGKTGPPRDVVLLNSAACLYLFLNKASWEDCLKMAVKAIDSGKAEKVMESFVELTLKKEL